MATINLKSAGVLAQEIDQTLPVGGRPSGVPAGVIGTALQGRAFVPTTVASFKDFVNAFGKTDATKFGPLAASEWLRNSKALTYIRVLGVGDGTRRTSSGLNVGKVTRAGFVVGDEQPQTNGFVGRNPYAVDGGIPGRVHFLGVFMSESAGSTIFSSAGIQDSQTARPIIRGVIFAPSGVVPMLSSSFGSCGEPSTSTPATAAGPLGFLTGAVDLSSAKQDFTLLLNGHKSTTDHPAVITASFDVNSPSYISSVFNTDPEQFEPAGHLLYTWYDIHPAVAVVTGTGVLSSSFFGGSLGVENVAFITTSSLQRNSGSTVQPNYESFEDRFRTARTSFIVSQKFSGQPTDLFRFHSLSDGVTSTRLKLSISNLVPGSEGDFGTFDIAIRDFDDTDSDPVVLEQFRSLTLDPSADRYIARVIGDQSVYFNFDRDEVNQRLTVDGSFTNVSKYVRVEVTDDVAAGDIPTGSLPMGFRGLGHLVTSGTLLTSVPTDLGFHTSGSGPFISRAVEPPIPLRQTVTVDQDVNLSANKDFYWGVQFEQVSSVVEPNRSFVANESILSHAKYFPNFHTVWLSPWVSDNDGVSDVNGTILDSDRFNRNFFSLENVQVRTGSDGLADPKEWASASYVRVGGITPNDSNKTRGLTVFDLEDQSARTFGKFSLFMQGEFDGVNIFDADTAELTNVAVVEEMLDSSRGQGDGPTVKAYTKALDVMANTSEVDVKLLAVPGIRHSVVTDLGISTAETRFDAVFLMDVEEVDEDGLVVTSSAQTVSVNETASYLDERTLDSSFAAAYFPDVTITDPIVGDIVQVPPTVVVLGAFALNDSVAHPWFAPAGFTRGALDSTVEQVVRLNQNNLDALYEVNINPITSFPGSGGPVVWGQKTLQAAQSSLDRVNVRRLLIEIRRQVREVSKRLTFEPNRQATLDLFQSLIRPRLQRIQDRAGLDKFKVIVDATTTTQADVENNTIRGKIYLQPTHTAEFVSLDFEVANAGAVV